MRGGGFVRDSLNDGCLAVGLEGSDFSKKTRRAEWATIPDFLFTCDLTKKYDILLDDEPMQFHLITSWEVMEHIAEADLPTMIAQVKKHLRPDGLWIMSISPNHEELNGVCLHQTVHTKSWWIDKFAQFGLFYLEEYVQYFNTQFIRGDKYKARRSFHLVLSLDPLKAPLIPKQGLTTKLYDRWLGSITQKRVRRLLMGE